MCDALLELMQDEINEMSEKVREKAIAEGRAEERIEIILDRLKRNPDCKKVADFLGIPLEQVEEIQNKNL